MEAEDEDAVRFSIVEESCGLEMEGPGRCDAVKFWTVEESCMVEMEDVESLRCCEILDSGRRLWDGDGIARKYKDAVSFWNRGKLW